MSRQGITKSSTPANTPDTSPSKKLTLTPTQAANTDTCALVFDFQKAHQTYESKPDKKFIQIAPFKLGKSSFKFILKGEVSTQGIAVNEWDNNGKKTTTYSLGLRLEDEDDIEAFNMLNNKLADLLSGDYELTDPIKEDIIYLKLKASADKKSFGVLSNIKMDPKKPGDSAIQTGMIVTVQCNLAAYVNFANNTAGLVVKPTKFDFELD